MFQLADPTPEPFLAKARALLVRVWPALLIFVLAFAAVVALAPVKVGLVLYGIQKVALSALCGYLVDRGLFGRRPHTLVGLERSEAERRRAYVFIGCALIVGLLP